MLLSCSLSNSRWDRSFTVSSPHGDYAHAETRKTPPVTVEDRLGEVLDPKGIIYITRVQIQPGARLKSLTANSKRR